MVFYCKNIASKAVFIDFRVPFGVRFGIPQIDNLRYRFCDIFYDVFYVEFGTFWGRFGSHFGVQRVTKTRNSEIWKIAVLLMENLCF